MENTLDHALFQIERKVLEAKPKKKSGFDHLEAFKHGLEVANHSWRGYLDTDVFLILEKRPFIKRSKESCYVCANKTGQTIEPTDKIVPELDNIVEAKAIVTKNKIYSLDVNQWICFSKTGKTYYICESSRPNKDGYIKTIRKIRSSSILYFLD